LDDRVDVYEAVELFYYFDIEVKDFTVTEVNVLKDVNSELRKLALNYLGANSFDELEHLDSTPEVIDVACTKAFLSLNEVTIERIDFSQEITRLKKNLTQLTFKLVGFSCRLCCNLRNGGTRRTRTEISKDFNWPRIQEEKNQRLD